LADVVTALMAMRGIDFISATAFLAEIGDLSRFRTPRELMAYLGLVPSEASTGDTVKRGPITKAGNRRARRILVDAPQRTMDEFYSITSSARPSSESGTAMLSAFAVLRLMNNSTFVDCCTGRSTGFAPLRTRPV
jgi:hypothetical protein